MDRLLYLLETNPRLTNAELAIMLGVSEQQVEQQIKLYEESACNILYASRVERKVVPWRRVCHHIPTYSISAIGADTIEWIDNISETL